MLSEVEGEVEGYITLAAEVPAGFGKYIEKIAREIWEKKALEQGYDPVLVQAYGERLSEAVTKGWGKDLFQMDFDELDYDKLKHLHIDAWKFATGKTNEHLNEISAALRRPDGTLRTFEEFRVQTVIATGKQLRGLKAEYNTAVASAQMASKWEQIQRTKDTYPYLEYVAVLDDHVTEKCARLDGVIRHVDDAFWQQYYPPNHYNCRSTVKQLRQIPEGYQDPFAEPKLPEEFKTDFIMKGHLFPADHKYYGLSPNELFNKVREHLPYDLQFDKIELPEGAKGYLQQHFMTDIDNDDYARLLEIARGKAIDSNKIEIMPTLDPNKYSDLREIIFPDAKPGKSPDLRINTILWEEESIEAGKPLTQANISRKLSKGIKQANHIIISLYDDVNVDILWDVQNGKFKASASLQMIEFRMPGRTVVYKRAKPHE